MPRPPWKVGVYAGLIVIAIAMVLGSILAVTVHRPPDPERLGEATGQLALTVGVVAYLVARWRGRK